MGNNNDNGNDRDNTHMTEYCVMCRRPDTSAGKMIHMPGNLCVCGDCMQKMMDFVSEEDVCRSAYLLEYFGQKESADCGNCDICRSAKDKTAGLDDSAVRISDFINDEKSGRYTIEDVIVRFSSATSSDSDDLMSVLRRIIDDGTVPPPQI